MCVSVWPAMVIAGQWVMVRRNGGAGFWAGGRAS